jgi:hypothetical protein
MSTQRITGAEARYQTKFAIGLLKGMQDSKSNIRMGGTAGRRLKGHKDGRLTLPSSYKTIYAGTVTADEVKKRRRDTKAARKANLRRRRGF